MRRGDRYKSLYCSILEDQPRLHFQIDKTRMIVIAKAESEVPLSAEQSLDLFPETDPCPPGSHPYYPDCKVRTTRRAADLAGGAEQVKRLVIQTVKKIYAGEFRETPGRWKNRYFKTDDPAKPGIVVQIDTQKWEAFAQAEDEIKPNTE